jgi:adenylate kinase
MDKIEPSGEQLIIINSKMNTIVDAVAGSGKTTTAILIASENKSKNIFQITYNSMLKIEVREKLEKFKINNMKIHTYHSIVTNFYDNSSFDDEHLKKIIKNNISLKKKIDKIYILLID